MSRPFFVIALVAACFACNSTAVGQEQVVFHDGQWWIVRRAEPYQHYQYAVADRAAEYKAFGDRVEQITLKMKDVARAGTEKADLRALEFLLRGYNEAVAAGDWRQADAAKERMRVYLVRGGAVASEAAKRKAAQERAEAERARAFAERMQRREHEFQAKLHRDRMLKAEQLRQAIQYGGW